MSRSERLLALLQIMRRHRRPVSGSALAAELSISLRTLYRDIASLRSQGAGIEGEPGLGYVLQPGFMLPPLMFSEDEIEALVLGSRWVGEQGDPRLAAAARQALAKIATVLPDPLRATLETAPLLVGPNRLQRPDGIDLAVIRQAIQAEQKLVLLYRDAANIPTERIVWPFALGFFEKARILVGWCELRGDFRHFRSDRIAGATTTGSRYPRRRRVLLKEWKTREGITRPFD